MFLHESLRGQKVLNRKGVIREVLLPDKKLLASDITIRLGTEQIEFRDGESIFVLDKQIGVKEQLQTTIFIAGEYLVCEILLGVVYVKENGKIYSITDTGTKKLSKVREEELKWVTVEDYIDYITPLVGVTYNINNKKLIKQYIDNMSIDVTMKNTVSIEEIAGKPEELYLFSIKVLQRYLNFGLDKFEFKVYEKVEVHNEDLEPLDSYTIWKQEKEREKRERIALRKAEQVYLSIREGEDIVDYDEEMGSLSSRGKLKLDDNDEDDLELEEYYDEDEDYDEEFM